MDGQNAIAVASGLVLVGIIAWARLRTPRPEPEPERGRRGSRPAPLPLSEATRAALVALDFEPRGDSFWDSRTPEPGTDDETVTYTVPDVEDRLHELWIAPEDLPSLPAPLLGLELRVRQPGDDAASELVQDWLLPEATAPGAVIELVRQREDGGTRTQDPATPEDAAACQRFLNPALVAQLAAIPHARLDVKQPSPTEYEVWVRWPELDERSGTHAGAALALLRAVAARLREGGS